MDHSHVVAQQFEWNLALFLLLVPLFLKGLAFFQGSLPSCSIPSLASNPSCKVLSPMWAWATNVDYFRGEKYLKTPLQALGLQQGQLRIYPMAENSTSLNDIPKFVTLLSSTNCTALPSPSPAGTREPLSSSLIEVNRKFILIFHSQVPFFQREGKQQSTFKALLSWRQQEKRWHHSPALPSFSMAPLILGIVVLCRLSLETLINIQLVCFFFAE